MITSKRKAGFSLKERIHLIRESTDSENIKAKKIKLLQELCQFKLGRYLLIHSSLNGYWTSYLISEGLKVDTLHPLESWMLNHAPGIKATRERFAIFQQQTQIRLKDNMSVASAPCGVMDDLLTLDYSNLSNIKLIGIDLDQESLALAQAKASKQYIPCPQFLQKDIYNLNLKNEFDLILNNGLNIYESSPEKLIEHYRQLAQALTKNGTLITSFLTPSPTLSEQSPWRSIDKDALEKQTILFSDLIQVSWQNYQDEKTFCNQLHQAGLEVIEIIYDTHCLFPTVIAKKR